MSVEEYFETGPEFERPIFEAVLKVLKRADPDIWFEPVSVGIFFKRRSTFVSLRTMTKWIAVGFNLDRKLTSNRLSRKVQEHSGRYYHVINVKEADEIDDQLAEWLVEAWRADE